jgi:3'(2'), 5'-bisphosphate nucleotidase
MVDPRDAVREALERILAIGAEAGNIVMSFRRSKALAVREKDDHSPVTAADLAADEYLRPALERAFGIPVVSEEKEVAYEIRKEWPEFFLLDPVDGTQNFIAGEDDFTINIAWVRNHQPVLGVVCVPATDELFYAAEGEGAFHRAGKAIANRLPMIQCREITLARSRFHHVAKNDRFAELNGVREWREMSSAIRLPRLAQGAITVHPGFAGSKEWDTAAGQVLVLESGGAIRDLVTGCVPEYNKPSMENNPFLATGNGIRLDSLILPQD